jgi:predicted TIM-barrel fold metal-dependent hydrolase
MSTSVVSDLGYGLVDADNHYYEPYDCFTRFAEPAFRDQAVNVVVGDDGYGRVFIGTRPAPWRPIIQADLIAPPGANKGLVSGDPTYEEPTLIRPLDIPAFMHRDARLKLMDEQGVQGAILLPTTAVCLEYYLYDDGPAAAFANLRAFNRWLEEDWGFAHEERIFGIPMLSLADIDLAVAELDRVLERGARAVHLNPGPAYGRSPADPHFDPFWARVQEAGVPVIFHIGYSGYNEMVGVHWGERTHVSLYEQTALQNFLGLCDRPITDTFAALILGGLFERFPDLRILSVENGCRWARPFMADVDHAAKLSRVHKAKERPSDVFRRHFYVAPFWEDSGVDLAGLIGVDHVLLGSDFPHPEGEANPIDFVNSLAGLDDADIRRIMRDNTAALVNMRE